MRHAPGRPGGQRANANTTRPSPRTCAYKGERRAHADLRDTTLLRRCPFFPIIPAGMIAIRMVRSTPASEGAITPRLDNGSSRRRLYNPSVGKFQRRCSRGSFRAPRRRLAPTAGSLRSRRAVLSSFTAVALFGCGPHNITCAGWPASGAGHGLCLLPIHMRCLPVRAGGHIRQG